MVAYIFSHLLTPVARNVYLKSTNAKLSNMHINPLHPLASSWRHVRILHLIPVIIVIAILFNINQIIVTYRYSSILKSNIDSSLVQSKTKQGYVTPPSSTSQSSNQFKFQFESESLEKTNILYKPQNNGPNEKNTNQHDEKARNAVIHIGPHKTGTTTIQTLSIKLREALAKDGYEMPWSYLDARIEASEKEGSQGKELQQSNTHHRDFQSPFNGNLTNAVPQNRPDTNNVIPTRIHDLHHHPRAIANQVNIATCFFHNTNPMKMNAFLPPNISVKKNIPVQNRPPPSCTRHLLHPQPFHIYLCRNIRSCPGGGDWCSPFIFGFGMEQCDDCGFLPSVL